MGLIIWKRKSKYYSASKDIRKLEFLCSKECFNLAEGSCEEKKRNTLETRIGYKAFIRLRAFRRLLPLIHIVMNFYHLLRYSRHIAKPKA